MPSTTPIDPNVSAAQAVSDGTHTLRAQTISGTASALTATPAGATGLTVAQNAGFSTVGGLAVDDAAIPAFGWIVTLLYQRVKHSPKVNQDNDKWIWLLGISLVVLLIYYLLSTHGDWILAVANSIRSAGLTTANAMSNYHTVKPLGWFSSAEEM